MRKSRSDRLSLIKLPINRFQQFSFIYRTNGFVIVKLSLLCFLFFIPLLTQLILFLIYLGPIINGSKSIDMKVNELSNLIRIFSLFFIISIPLGAIGISTMNGVLKRLIYNDGFVLSNEIKNGLKESKNCIGHSLLFSFLIFTSIFGLFWININKNYSLFLTLSIIIGILLLVLLVVYSFSLLISNYYSCSFLQNIKNSFILSFATLPKSLGLLFLGLSPFLVLYFLDLFIFSRLTFLTLIGVLYLLFIGFGNISLMFNLNAVASFDKFINKQSYEEIYQLGLYKEDYLDE